MQVLLDKLHAVLRWDGLKFVTIKSAQTTNMHADAAVWIYCLGSTGVDFFVWIFERFISASVRSFVQTHLGMQRFSTIDRMGVIKT